MQTITAYLEKLSAHKELLVTSLVAVFCILLSAFFPTDNQFQLISKNIFFLVFLPMLYIKLILKGNLSDWGWNFENKKEGALLGALAFLASLIIFYLIIRFTTFSSHYTISPLVRNNFGIFILYELVFFNIFFFTQEFFFKGFLLFSFRPFFVYSVLIQAGVYCATTFLSSSPSLQALPLIFLSLIGGYVTYKTRSFLYSYIFGLLFIIILDAYIIHLVK